MKPQSASTPWEVSEHLHVSMPYAMVLQCVTSKALPPDVSILYRQWQKEAILTENATAYQKAQSHVKNLLSFMKVQVEIREESGF